MSPRSRHRPPPVSGPGDQYFVERPASRSRPAEVTLTLADLTVRLRTDAGVFSPSRVDPGTRLLLGELPPVETWPDGDVVDIGCGYGPIAIAIARRAPDRAVWAVETNERARELCRSNAADVGLAERIRVVAPEDVPPALRVGLVASNPPIRIGKAALHDLCRDWLGRLTPDGEAWWVVQKHLGSDSLQAWMRAEGWPTERVRSRQSYRILRSRSAPPAAA